MKRDWHKILYSKSDVIPVEDLIMYCEDRAAQYEQEWKEYWDDFPDFKANVKGYANVYRNIAGALKHGQSNEGALQCEHCRVPFIPKTSRAKFCSPKCRVAFFRKNEEGTMVYGWMQANSEIRLWVYENKEGWGVTEDVSQAKRFKDIHECADHWRSKHSFPEQSEHCITDGYLFYAEYRKGNLEFLTPSQISDLLAR